VKSPTRFAAVLALALCAIAPALYAQAITVTLTSSAPTGVSPHSHTLTWSAPGATTCTASGSWTGTKATSGTQTITGLTANASYVLTCTKPAVLGSATVKWTAPTTNTDGTPLTDLVGYRLYHSTLPGTIGSGTPITIANPAAVSYLVSGLPDGLRYFGMQAYTATATSSMSGLATKTIAGTPAVSDAETVAVTVTTQPSAPVITVVESTVYNIGSFDVTQWKVKTNLPYGTVPIGTRCDATRPAVNSYYVVPRSAVKWGTRGSLSYPLAKCKETPTLALSVE
jgi:hypothetical protein